MSDLLQTCLLLGVAAPLASFLALVFFGRRVAAIPAPQSLLALSAGAVEHHGDGHGHDSHLEHRPPPGDPLAGWIATAAIGFSLLMAIVSLAVWSAAPDEQRAAAIRAASAGLGTWFTLGTMPIQLGVKLDSLTIVVYLMVTICSTCIHLFSIGYMQGDPRFTRFFAYLSLFCFSMLGLVVSPNLLFLFIFWELVGVCSYLLIGFWFEKKSASNAAIKAFITNRVGDLGFMAGLGLCVLYLGTLSLDDAAAVFAAGAHKAGWLHESPVTTAIGATAVDSASQLFQQSWLGVSLATWMGIGLFCGAMGKSAQFPLHVWLPDAMEGPTPVSALIHAATMVAAGVYLVARVFMLLTPGAQQFIVVIGCITLTMAAMLALVQTDIKRVLAYSTLSQLGYMIFGMGVGAWVGALFHLLTHAFFKALLFLGSGQVIAGCGHEQDIRRMGGLARKMPVTAATFGLAVLAISGVGIPWTPLGIGGFYSKDEILAVSTARWASSSHADAHGLPGLFWLLAALPIVIAYVTPFYMGRCYVLTFLGQPRDERLHAHAREHSIMTTPLLILAGFTLVSGWFLFRGLVHAAAPGASLATLVDPHTAHSAAVEHAHRVLPYAIGFAWLVGLGGAYFMYRNGLAIGEQVVGLPIVRQLHAAALRRFYFDEIYDFAFVGGAKALAVVCRLFDEWIVDGFVNNACYVVERIARFCGWVLDLRGVDGAVNGVGAALQTAGESLRQTQTGRIRNYILLAVTGLTSLALGLAAGFDFGWSVLLAAVVILAVAAPWGDVARRVLALADDAPPDTWNVRSTQESERP